MLRPLFSFLCINFLILTSQAQTVIERDFAAESRASNDLVGHKTVITTGLGIDPSGGWTNESKWATFPQKVAMKDIEVSAHFPSSDQGNPNSFGQVTFRSTDLSNGVGVRLHGGQDKAQVAIVEDGKITHSQVIKGLSPRFAAVKLAIRLQGSSLEVDIHQSKGERWQEVKQTITAKLSPATDRPGYFIYHAVPANKAICLAKLKITNTGANPVSLREVDWPPKAATKSVSPPKPAAPPTKPSPPVQTLSFDDIPVGNHLVKDIRILSPEWICLVTDCTAQVHRIMKQNLPAQEVLTQAKSELDTGKNTWKYPIVKAALAGHSQTQARMALLPKYDDASQWLVNGSPPSLASYYPYSVGTIPREGDAFSPHHDSNTPRIAEYIYLKLPTPLADKSPLSISHKDGLNQTFDFDSEATPCWSIKVNQVGYLPGANKVAYLGMWAGFEGTVDFATFAGKPFHIRSYQAGKAVGEPLFTGNITLRARAKDQYSPAVKSHITGEDVYEMDFSKLAANGQFCLHIPGLGRSWPFQIGEDAFGNAYYHTARGLYHQRGSIALQPPHTNWVRGKTKQPILKGGYLPETDRWYDKRLGYAKSGPKAGFRTEDGQPTAISAFSMIHSTATTEPYPGMESGGGWHDAADYDRRIHHYKCVWDLCGVYEMYPNKFTDGQLNIPESGNGIPDILDEAAVQVDFFIKTQRPDGGVSSWVEQTSHPKHGRPENDTQPFYVSLPDRLGSFEFAASATYLGRMIKPFDAQRATRYFEAAKRAYTFADDDNNQITDLTFTIAKGSNYDAKMIGKTLTFTENKKLPTQGSSPINQRKFKALIQLTAIGSQPHQTELQKLDIAAIYLTYYPQIHSFACVTPLLLSDRFKLDDDFLANLAKLSDRWHHGGQEESAYRQLWRKKDDGYFGAMGWGNSHGPRNAQLPLVLYRFTNDKIWKDRIINGMNWQFGCNAVGISHTTGIGSVFPVVFQHIHSSTDEFLEPVPGFSPFQPTGYFPMFVFQKQYATIQTPHSSVNKVFPNQFRSFLPSSAGHSELQNKLNQIATQSDAGMKAYRAVRDHVGGRIPMMRRYVIHDSLAPGHNEFTVNESISPHAAVLGALIPDGWLPSKEIKNRQPKMTESELPFYPQP